MTTARQKSSVSGFCVYLCACILIISEAAICEPLPEGSVGIASRYPGDVGIQADSAVLFSDDFESYGSAADISSRWNQVFHLNNIRIATESANVFNGKRSVELALPIQNSEVSNNLIKAISPERDALFFRYYAKYDVNFSLLGSSHNGSSISGHYCCPGVPADGYNKFLVSLEAGRDDSAIESPGFLNIYIYHPDQRDIWGDHFFPTGRVVPFDRVPGDFGPDFVPRPDVIPTLGRWYSYEMMVRLNTPGARDGRIAIWMDGQIVADFPNLRFRETSSLRIDQVTLDLHARANSSAVARKWYDNVVVATSYIGPITEQNGVRPKPPTNLGVN